jgi:hypothetical protein
MQSVPIRCKKIKNKNGSRTRIGWVPQMLIFKLQAKLLPETFMKVAKDFFLDCSLPCP